MKLSVNIIFEELPFSNCQIWDTKENNRTIENVLFLQENMSDLSAEHLYIGPVTLLPPVQAIPHGVSFLCYGRAPFSQEEALDFNLIVVEDDVPIYTLFNLLQQTFMKFYRWEQELEAAIQSNAPLQSFIDFSTEIIGWPLAIIDIAQGTLAISDFSDSDDIIWNELQKGYIHTDLCTRDSIQNEDIEEVIGPVQLYSTISERILLSQAVRIRNHTVGFVSAHRPTAGTEKFSRCTEQLIDCLTTAITKRMSSSEFYQYSRGFILDCLISDLIDRKITDRDTIQDRLEFAKWEGYTDSRIYVMTLHQKEPKKAGLQFLLEQLESLLPCSKALYYHGSFVVLQQIQKHEAPAHAVDTRLLQWMQLHDMVCGISNRFTDYSRMADYYTQAQKALYFGSILQPGTVCYFYRDYIREHMLETLSRTTDLRLFLHPDMQQLIHHSKTKDYIYDTLRQLIRNDFNIINTSKAMYIHKNTLSYRIHQIEDLAQFSFNDPNTRAVLTSSFHILSYMVIFQNYNVDTDAYEADRPKAKNEE